MGDIAIKVENLSKNFRVGNINKNSLRGALSNIFKPNKPEEFWALQDINFEVKKGEAIGIIGRNGAGKSTLLKILSKITPPTTGKITMFGRVSSLLEVGTGFHLELTGRENIFLNGSLLGMTRDEINQKFDEIVDFSGVEKFIDTPVKHYSTGMYMRLAFSVSAHLNTEILLIDEVLAVGDSEFQKKCLGKMDEVTEEGKTVLIVSHDSNVIKSLTNRAVLLSNSKIKCIEESNKIFELYYSDEEIGNQVKFIDKPISDIEVLYSDYVSIDIRLNIDDRIKFPHLCFMISNSNGDVIVANNPKYQKLEIPLNKRNSRINVSVKAPKFRYGKYFLSVWVADGLKSIFEARDCVSFSVTTIEKKDKHLGYIIPDFTTDFDVL